MRYFKGRVFYIYMSKDNQTVRCDECQHKRDIKRRNQWRDEWRKRKKS